MILCFGEIVWDLFQSAKVLGGAPLNVAYHLTLLSHTTKILSRLGNDPLGTEALQKIQDLGIATDCIQSDPLQPTGTVSVSITNNEPSFDIAQPAAWDYIEMPPSETKTAKPLHLVFGTLAQRSDVSKQTLRSLCSQAKTIFYDVNLRPPFTPRETVLFSLAAADVVKVNEEELGIIGSWGGLPATTTVQQAEALRRHYDLRVLAVTLGAKGALIVSSEGPLEVPGIPVQIADSVGAGDAFFAALIHGILQNLSLRECLQAANKRGAYVASHCGATPDMTDL